MSANDKSQLEYFQFSYNDDNYGVLIHDSATGQTACMDAGDDKAVLTALAGKNWTLSEVWITHHHWDHTDGLRDLKSATNCLVRGPVDVPGSKSIEGVDVRYGDGESFEFAGAQVRIIATPGHTMDMINYYLPGDDVLFAGDTLFAMGCGRLFEGTPADMFASLKKLAALPPNTTIYCSHEYTSANAKFASSVDASNASVAARQAEVASLRQQGMPTVPTTLALELDTNPFLRFGDAKLRAQLNMANADDLEVFTKLRTLKDSA